MASFAKELLELRHALQGLQLSGYVDTGGFAILVYDYMLTFEDERTLIWQSNWTPPKVLFLMTRYLPIVDISITAMHHFRKGITPEACSLAYKSAGWLINFGIMLAELIMAIQSWAVWGKSRSVAIALSFWSAILLIADLTIMTFFMKSIGFSPLPVGLSGCLVTSGNTLIIGVWVILMIYEAGIVALMVWKGVQFYHQLGYSALYKAVFTNGAIFYVYIFALSVANVIIISRLSRDQSTMLATIERVTHAVLTQRLLLTLRKASLDPDNAQQSTELESMRFDEGAEAISTIDAEVGLETDRSSTIIGQKDEVGHSSSLGSSSARSLVAPVRK